MAKEPSGYYNPLHNFQVSPVIGYSPKRGIIDVDGIETEITYLPQGFLIRAGSEGLVKCDDYCGAVYDSDLLKGIFFADGVGSSVVPSVIPAQIITSALKILAKNPLLNLEDLFYKVLEHSFIELPTRKELVELMRQKIDQSPNLQQFRLYSDTDIERLQNSEIIAATTLQGLRFTDLTLDALLLGDGYIATLNRFGLKDELNGTQPLQIGYYRSHTGSDEVGYSGNPSYKRMQMQPGDIALSFTDGPKNCGLKLREIVSQLQGIQKLTDCDPNSIARIFIKPRKVAITNEIKLSDDVAVCLIQV